MSVIVSNGGRRPLSTTDRVAAPTEEKAAAFSTFLAYAGRYTLTSDKVTHHVEVASIENWVNTDLVRAIKFEGNRITLTTPPQPVGGSMQIFELIWERMR